MDWEKSGVFLWDDNSQTIARLTGTQALQLLEELERSDVWTKEEITVGEPATMIALDDPNPSYESTLINKIQLAPLETQQVFDFLLDNKDQLEEIQKAEDEEQREILGRVVKYLLRMGDAERSAKEPSNT